MHARILCEVFCVNNMLCLSLLFSNPIVFFSPPPVSHNSHPSFLSYLNLLSLSFLSSLLHIFSPPVLSVPSIVPSSQPRFAHLFLCSRPLPLLLSLHSLSRFVDSLYCSHSFLCLSLMIVLHTTSLFHNASCNYIKACFCPCKS